MLPGDSADEPAVTRLGPAALQEPRRAGQTQHERLRPGRAHRHHRLHRRTRVQPPPGGEGRGRAVPAALPRPQVGHSVMASGVRFGNIRDSRKLIFYTYELKNVY